MFPIRCDHTRGVWPFTFRCRATATKHLLHHPKNGYGDDPQVLLLCAKHHTLHVQRAVVVVTRAKIEGRPLVLSSIIKDTGNI